MAEWVEVDPWWKNFGPTQEDNGCGSMSFPQTVTLSENQNALCFNFVPALNSYIKTVIQEKEVVLEPKQPYVREIASCDFLLELNYENENESNSLTLKIENKESKFVEVRIKDKIVEFETNEEELYNRGKM
ncbi:hypothetical protein EFK13_09595 [Bacillus cabrialesii]|uniref:hypothetical protein n=1 Tax=Bacillus cabrialesii TaxID=2487276 RepID=UPI001012311D|nr:hypothetical protein [Bacillus cabrialesii]UQE80803.1 hypothetical protein EFK13_09595 [Bacillus cabrialesii]